MYNDTHKSTPAALSTTAQTVSPISINTNILSQNAPSTINTLSQNSNLARQVAQTTGGNLLSGGSISALSSSAPVSSAIQTAADEAVAQWSGI